MIPTNETPRAVEGEVRPARRTASPRHVLVCAGAMLLVVVALASPARPRQNSTPSTSKQVPPTQTPEQPSKQPYPCPTMKFPGCGGTVTEGTLVTITHEFDPLPPSDVKLTYLWSATPDTITGGNSAPAVRLKTDGLAGKIIRVSLVLGVDGRTCPPTGCVVDVIAPKPTLTPTPTPTSSPTPSPSPAPTSSQTATPTPKPTPSATPSPSSTVVLSASPEVPTRTPTPAPSADPVVNDASGGRRWLIPAVILALGAGALAAAKLFLSGAGLSGGAASLAERLRDALGGGILGGTIALNKKKADKVHCTVFAPESAAPGDPFLVQVFAHLAKHGVKELAERAGKGQEDAREQGSDVLSEPVERGTKITFALKMEGLKVRERKKSLVWQGDIARVQFGVDVPEDFLPEDRDEKRVRGEVKIYYGEEHAPVGDITFIFKVARVGAPKPESAPTRPEQARRNYKFAFVSYCSKDLDKVLPPLRAMARRWEEQQVEYFFDRRNIPPGEEWEEVIKKNLDRCDLFVLFWSWEAKCSDEVGKEVSYAVARHASSGEKLPAFDPFSIDSPIPTPLPKGLESHHFGDELLNYMNRGDDSKAN